MAAQPRPYVERLSVPWWLWLPALALATGLAAEIHLGAGGTQAWLPYALLLPLTAVGLWWIGRIRIAVIHDPSGELQVDDARLPLRYVADAVPLDAAGKREILGLSAHPLAFVVQRPWVSGAVQILLDDPADPTPYWVISSRDPQRLAAEITAAEITAGRGVQPEVNSRGGSG